MTTPTDESIDHIFVDLRIGVDLDDPALLDWFLHGLDLESWKDMSPAVTCGSGPLSWHDLESTLIALGTESWDVGDALEFGIGFSALILGREGWTAKDLDECIGAKRGEKLWIFSQEMFVSSILCGRNPYGSPHVLEAFCSGHPGLEHLRRNGFDWPSTRIVPGATNGNVGGLQDAPTRGVLARLGYHVGRHGKGVGERRRILRHAFEDLIPRSITLGQEDEWGESHSSRRLHKMADCLASFARKQKGKQRGSAEAIGDWESDLEWLKSEFYCAAFSFRWPSTYVP